LWLVMRVRHGVELIEVGLIRGDYGDRIEVILER
jgi:hypothetical protein